MFFAPLAQHTKMVSPHYTWFCSCLNSWISNIENYCNHQFQFISQSSNNLEMHVTILPEYNYDRTLTASDNHQTFPDHECRWHNHCEIQELVTYLKIKDKILINITLGLQLQVLVWLPSVRPLLGSHSSVCNDSHRIRRVSPMIFDWLQLQSFIICTKLQSAPSITASFMSTCNAPYTPLKIWQR